MKKLPVLLSIPHGGTERPPELKEHMCITDKDLFDDSDPFVIEIYDLEERVKRSIKTHIARAFVDLNRSPQDLPPKNPDGLIKSATCYNKPIYTKGKEPDTELTKKLIEMYYKPYHKAIQNSIHELDIQLCLDCHSMASTAPNISPDGNQKKRPKFCVSNNDGKSSSNEMIEQLASSISTAFEIERHEISINDPFHGGYITRNYGNDPIPWIQIEMNRDMYLAQPWFDSKERTINASHLKKLNQQFEKCLNHFFLKSNF